MPETILHSTDIYQQQDQKSFAAVVEEYQAMVYNIVLGIVQQAEDAEDILQEVFVKLYEQWESFSGSAERRTWVYRVAVNMSLDALRKIKTAKRGGLLKRVFGIGNAEVPKSFAHPGVALDQKENSTLLFSALGQIPEKQRVAFLLQQLENQTIKEIAEILNTTVQATESLIKRAKENLRKILAGKIE